MEKVNCDKEGDAGSLRGEALYLVGSDNEVFRLFTLFCFHSFSAGLTGAIYIQHSYRGTFPTKSCCRLRCVVSSMSGSLPDGVLPLVPFRLY